MHPIYNKTNMKKIILIIATIIMPLLASAQAQIDTKKVKISDFTQKVTKVVLGGNEFFDITFQDEITAKWRISPFEFCTLEEFEQIKGDDDYYFLMMTYGQFRKETAPGLQFLTLVKGGKGADKGIGSMLEVVSLPFASAEYPTGRELVFLPAFIDIIQNHTLASMEKDINGYAGLASSHLSLNKADNMEIILSEDDLSDEISNQQKKELLDEGVIVTDEDEADRYMMDNLPGAIVSYMVVPSEPVEGSYCYKMLIDSQTHKLYYFKKHRIGKKQGPGFLMEDINRITAHRR